MVRRKVRNGDTGDNHPAPEQAAEEVSGRTLPLLSQAPRLDGPGGEQQCGVFVFLWEVEGNKPRIRGESP